MKVRCDLKKVEELEESDSPGIAPRPYTARVANRALGSRERGAHQNFILSRIFAQALGTGRSNDPNPRIRLGIILLIKV